MFFLPLLFFFFFLSGKTRFVVGISTQVRVEPIPLPGSEHRVRENLCTPLKHTFFRYPTLAFDKATLQTSFEAGRGGGVGEVE